MKLSFRFALVCTCIPAVAAQLDIRSFNTEGKLTVGGALTNGVLTVEAADGIGGPWVPARNVFTTADTAQVSLSITGATAF